MRAAIARGARWAGVLLADLKSDPAGRRLRPWLWIALPLAILALSTWGIRLTGFDLAFQEAIYLAGGESWAIGDHPFWQALYHFGTWPPALVIAVSLAGLVLGFYRERFRIWRKVFVFLILVAVIGPGLITNGILKEYWGRPRPRHVEEFGGHHPYEPILTIDPASDGKSFPCGHATMGFFFFAGYFLFRRHRRRLAEFFLVFSLAAGGLIGIARVVQGGHFFSDVIWAAGICWFSAIGLYFALRLDRSLVMSTDTGKRMSRTMKVVSAAAAVLALGGILVATPYRAERDIEFRNDFAREGPLEFRLRFTIGETDVVSSETFYLRGEAFGHGVPTSQVAVNYLEYDYEEYSTIIYQERLSGWLAEASEQLEIGIPWSRTRKISLEMARSRMWMELPGRPVATVIHIWNGEGDIFVKTNGTPVRVTGGDSDPAGGAISSRDGPSVEFLVEPEFEGRLVIDSRDVTPPEEE